MTSVNKLTEQPDMAASGYPVASDKNVQLFNTLYPEDLYQSALSYDPRPDDKFLVTYKKCGTTWAQQIGYLLFHRGLPAPSGLEFLKSSPFLEMEGAEAVRVMHRPGLIKTHLPYHLVPKSLRAKYLYVCRNPKDACVSFYYHTRGITHYNPMDGTFADFFDVFMKGGTEDGDYFDHVLSWYAHRDDSNVLMVHYEDMKRDPRSLILRMAEFLDERTHRMLIENESILEKVISHSRITFMKPHLEEKFNEFFTNPIADDTVLRGLRIRHKRVRELPRVVTLTRKGAVGDWKEHFTPEMSARMEEKIYQKLAHTDLINTWKKHGVISRRDGSH